MPVSNIAKLFGPLFIWKKEEFSPGVCVGYVRWVCAFGMCVWYVRLVCTSGMCARVWVCSGGLRACSGGFASIYVFEGHRVCA